jgi:hypothetical protein
MKCKGIYFLKERENNSLIASSIFCFGKKVVYIILFKFKQYVGKKYIPLQFGIEQYVIEITYHHTTFIPQ